MFPPPLPPPLPPPSLLPENNQSGRHRRDWWFVLGREPLLSVAEIFSVTQTTGDANSYQFALPMLRVRAEAMGNFQPNDLIQRLGGTIKIAFELGTNLAEEQLIDAMTTEAEMVEGKINFGISRYPLLPQAESVEGGSNSEASNTIEQWAKEIKNRLKEKGRSVRYISSDEATLNSATVFHNHLDTKGREFLITQITRINDPDYTDSAMPSSHERGRRERRYDLAYTRAIQPIEDLSARDFGRPGRDDVSGMLPPKLAMMMINIATGNLKLETRNSELTILDPFCGSGTILTEAIRLGFKNSIGTDISEKAIADTKKNVDWTIAHLPHFQLSISNFKIFQSSIVDLSKHIDSVCVDAIITEPFMGPPLTGRETPDQIKKTCVMLADLYTKAFEQFAKFLKPGGTAVFIIPRFTLHDTRYTISDRIIPKLKEFGFTKERLLPESLTPTSYILYHRPGQRVGREIWKFRWRG